ncbi:glycosyltransferase family 2 protein [Winogradskyella immobilis]|uniref:Glycosyltransferase family 2 protein n=1 Tax=Winogradskyella immobilis TaxID=2816852 RepID=A0ABS8ENF4_9FLAO|nr:glycosyltransferase [Winogradskyella immobilis]MCC1484100.1 glycosyltransferase family 2 protein [Winogradskyella immobilis]MCG0016192.1 glycosyltransferase [Winogradskyella immobilis]
MLSVLIPTYNYNIVTLVNNLHQQLSALAFNFEIIVLDDASTTYTGENSVINNLSHSTYTILKKNIGRSAIRNHLAKIAKYDTLLFLDADTKLISQVFIKNYIDALNKDTQIIYGGILYKENPNHNQTLRWAYGRKREALPLKKRLKQPHLRFLTLNFLIKKSVFEHISFNESIPNQRHEDTLFAMDAKTHHIKVDHIDNPVLHIGLESNSVFFKKSLESIDALKLFINEGLLEAKHTKLSYNVELIKKYKLSGIISFIYTVLNKRMQKNLHSENPNLIFFDFYRVGYYLQNN